MTFIVIGVWLVLMASATVVCTLVARGGLREDRTRGYLDDQDPRPHPVAPGGRLVLSGSSTGGPSATDS